MYIKIITITHVELLQLKTLFFQNAHSYILFRMYLIDLCWYRSCCALVGASVVSEVSHTRLNHTKVTCESGTGGVLTLSSQYHWQCCGCSICG